MENMRRTLLQPTLRMSNGGNFFTRLVGGSKTGKTLAGRGAAIDAATAAAAPTPAPAPPPKPERTVADIRFKDGGSLRTGAGGHVPGKGQGDKIDALYEPGEFVVSNDMLDAAPELRSELSSLRGRVLASKGMTPEQADAKAVGHTSLRAANGLDPYVNHRAPNPRMAAPPPQLGYTPAQASTALAVDTRPNFTVGSAPAPAVQPAVQPATSTFGDEAVQRARDAAARRSAAPGAPAPGAPAAPAPTRMQNVMSGAKSMAGGALRAVGGAGLGYGAADAAIRTFRDDSDPASTARREGLVSQIPLQDGSAAPYSEPQPFTPGERVMRGAREFADKTLPALPGIAATMPLTGAANSLRTGGALAAAAPSRLAVGGFVAGAGARGLQEMAGTETTAPTPTPAAGPAQTPTGLPAGTSLRSPGIYETRRPGQAVEFGDQASLTDTGFRNRGAISAQNMAAADALDARYRSAASPGDEGGQPDGGLFIGSDTGGFGLLDKNYQRERSLRMETTSSKGGLESGAGYKARIQGAAEALKAFNGEQSAAPRLRAEREVARQDSLRKDSTARRGQDLDALGRAGEQQSAAAVQNAKRIEDNRKYELDVARLGVDAANKEWDNKRAGEAGFDKRIEGMVGTDKDGKPDLRAASQVRNAANAFLAKAQRDAEDLLAQQPGNKKAMGVIDDIKRNGVAGIDDDTMRSFMVGAQANSVAKKDDGLWPWSSKSTNTSAPVGSLELENNFLFPNRFVADNGQKLSKGAVKANPDLSELVKPPKPPREQR